MKNTSVTVVRANRLGFAASPAAHFAGAALDAMRAAGLPDGAADFIIVAVPGGEGPSLGQPILDLARAAPATVKVPA